MGEVSLTRGVRANLLQLQRNQALRLEVADRLATGRRVNRVQDAQKDFFTAQALSNRIGNLINRRTEIGQGQSTIETGQVGLRAIEDLTRQLRGIANAARGGTAAERQTAAEQFDEVRNQITNLASDAGFGGTSLIADPADDLNVNVGDRSGAQVSVNGQASSAGALGIGTAASDHNGFATDADIDAAIAEATTAEEQVRSSQARFGSDIATLETRDRFNRNLANTLQSTESNLTSADLNEEAARRLALQVRDQIGQNALGFALRTQSLVVDLLSPGNG